LNVRARAPASSANLGPGFDALALALSLYVDVDVEPADELSVHTEGEGADLPQDGTHLAGRIATAVAGATSLWRALFHWLGTNEGDAPEARHPLRQRPKIAA